MKNKLEMENERKELIVREVLNSHTETTKQGEIENDTT